MPFRSHLIDGDIATNFFKGNSNFSFVLNDLQNVTMDPTNLHIYEPFFNTFEIEHLYVELGQDIIFDNNEELWRIIFAIINPESVKSLTLSLCYTVSCYDENNRKMSTVFPLENFLNFYEKKLEPSDYKCHHKFFQPKILANYTLELEEFSVKIPSRILETLLMTASDGNISVSLMKSMHYSNIAALTRRSSLSELIQKFFALEASQINVFFNGGANYSKVAKLIHDYEDGVKMLIQALHIGQKEGLSFRNEFTTSFILNNSVHNKSNSTFLKEKVLMMHNAFQTLLEEKICEFKMIEPIIFPGTMKNFVSHMFESTLEIRTSLKDESSASNINPLELNFLCLTEVVLYLSLNYVPQILPKSLIEYFGLEGPAKRGWVSIDNRLLNMKRRELQCYPEIPLNIQNPVIYLRSRKGPVGYIHQSQKEFLITLQKFIYDYELLYNDIFPLFNEEMNENLYLSPHDSKWEIMFRNYSICVKNYISQLSILFQNLLISKIELERNLTQNHTISTNAIKNCLHRFDTFKQIEFFDEISCYSSYLYLVYH